NASFTSLWSREGSSAANGLEELEVRQRDDVRGSNDGDIFVFEELAEREPVVERDGRRAARRGFFARAREDLPRRDEPAGRSRTVVVERATEIADALASDLASVFSDHERGADFVAAGFVDRGEVGLAAGRARAADHADLRHPHLLERDERELDERV